VPGFQAPSYGTTGTEVGKAPHTSGKTETGTSVPGKSDRSVTIRRPGMGPAAMKGDSIHHADNVGLWIATADASSVDEVRV